LKACLVKARGKIECLTWAGPLLARLTLGGVFIDSGWQKLHDIPSIVEYFESLHIPFATIQAPMVAGLEFTCGILVLLGLFTRVAVLPLIGIMTVAILTAKIEDLKSLSDLLGFAEFCYIVLCIWLFTNGPGKASLDRRLFP
jgi:putative oxidoreductase